MNKLKNLWLALVALTLMLGTQAQAALPADVVTAITGAGADMTDGAGKVIVAVIAAAALVGAGYFVIRLVRKGA